MLRSKFSRFAFLLTGLALAGSLLSAQSTEAPKSRKYKVPPPSSRIEVTVVRDINGKPIENASVVFHPIEGEHDRGNMELKTNEDGKCLIDVIPVGDTVRMQIIARGFQTTGQDFKVDKETIHFEVRLKRPGDQFSIYKSPGQSTAAPAAPTPDKPVADKPAAVAPPQSK